jgi:hypothetical protein
VVLASSIRQAREDGLPLREAIARLRDPLPPDRGVGDRRGNRLPARGALPGIGAEIQRPLARVVIGGLIVRGPEDAPPLEENVGA